MSKIGRKGGAGSLYPYSQQQERMQPQKKKPRQVLTAMDFLMGVGFEGGCFERLEKGQMKGQEALNLGFVKFMGPDLK